MKLSESQRKRIHEQSKEVAAYMVNPKKYNVTWTCPKCGNCHNWWWEDEFEARDDDACVMTCDRCESQTWCKGDGNGFYEPIEEEMKAKDRRDFTMINSVLDELQSSRETHHASINNILGRLIDLESLEEDLHNYVRELEDKVNTNNRLAFDAINSVTKRLIELENTVAQRSSKLKKKKEKEENKPSFLDLIDGPKAPFHARLREGCQFTKEELPPDKLASALRFIAVEVQRMTERDMGGSFTISNLKVAENLQDLAAEASVEDYVYDPDHEDEQGPGWGPHGWEGEDE